MNKKIIKLLISIVAVIMVLSLSSCGLFSRNDINNDEGIDIVVVLKSKDNAYRQLNISTTSSYLHEALIEFAEADSTLEYDYDDMGFGPYVKSIGNVAADSSGFVGVFHNIDDDTLIDLAWNNPITYDSIVYNTSGYGVSELPLYDGAKYMLAYVSLG